mgnify:CR=1 FL=1
METPKIFESEYRFCLILWEHEPIKDFWRIGNGYTRKLHAAGLYTMGDIARYSLSRQGEDRLYKLFGVNAELLIDHAWGYEPCTIEDIMQGLRKVEELKMWDSESFDEWKFVLTYQVPDLLWDFIDDSKSVFYVGLIMIAVSVLSFAICLCGLYGIKRKMHNDQ